MIWWACVFLFGLIVGSFLNCVIYRLGEKKSFLIGRSFCPNCGHILSWKDLIPIVSFLILGGKCRYCSKKISFQYPLVELSTALLFTFTFFNFQNYITLYSSVDLIFYWVIFSFLIIIFVFDLRHYLIPDKIITPALSIAFFYRLFKIWNFGHWNFFEIWNGLFGILPSLFFLVLILISKETWMGWGDFKLSILIGLILGWPKIVPALFFSFFVGAIFGIFLITLKKKSLKSEIPFGPFLVSGTIFSVFFGEKIIDFYLDLFLLK